MRLFARHPETVPAGRTEADVKRAYEVGRRDERKRHHSHPILGLVIAVAAVIGVGAIYLGFHEGSFSRAGQVVDENLATAADHSQTASQAAAETVADAGSAAQQAGQNLRQNDQPTQQR
jgi:hypothetical protein